MNLKSFFVRLFFISFFIALVIAVIGFARGYRLDLEKRSVSPTGILAVISSPKAAKVYLNGEFKGVTDLNMTLPPGNYKVEVQKEGYTSYATNITLKGELVETVDPILFPINPSLTPLTNLGVVKAVQVDQSDKIILFVDNNSAEKDGIYLFDSNNKAISFFPPLKTIILKSKLSVGIDFSKTLVNFSPDFKQAIFDFTLADDSVISYLFTVDAENQELFDVTNSKPTLLAAWEQEKAEETTKIMESFPKEIQKIASDSFNIVSFSPSKTKILYRAKLNLNLPLIIDPPLIASNQTNEERSVNKNSVYVYDLKEDKNFLIDGSDFDEEKVRWYSDSKRFALKDNGRLSIINYDGKNKQTVYSGPIEEGFFAVNSGGQLIIMANLNPQLNKLPDLYQIGIR